MLSLLPSAWAFSPTYYARLDLKTASGATGAGSVYASQSEQAPSESSYKSESTKDGSTQSNGGTVTFYAHALPASNYQWSHWSDEETGEKVVAEDNPYKVDITTSSDNSSSPATKTLYAVFRKLPPRTPIEKPTAATGLVYDGTMQTGVAAGEHYTLGGTYQAKGAGTYEATVTPASGYCWPDETYDAVKLRWSIARRSVTVSVLPTSKTVGEEEPLYPTKAEGFVDGDATETEVSWKVWRTDLVEQEDGSLAPNEAVGTYDLVVSGAAQTANYSISYVNGPDAFEIRPAGPSMSADDGVIDYDPTTKEVVVTPGDGVRDVEIVNMPSDATAQVPVSVDTVKGVTSEQIVVVAEATNETGTVKVDITDAFTIGGTSAGVTIELNDDPAAKVEIEIGGEKETIRVKPQLTDSGDAVVEPLEVATENVELGVKTIPGLTYHLKRSTTLGGGSEEVARETAKGTRTKLTDPMVGEKPSQAFYVIEVTK